MCAERPIYSESVANSVPKVRLEPVRCGADHTKKLYTDSVLTFASADWMRRMKTQSKLLLILAICFTSSLANAQTPVTDGKVPDGKEDVRHWAEKLESKRYAVRNQATTELLRRGLSVIDEVEEIALHGSTEAADRAFGILEQHYFGDDPLLKKSAAEKLARIAEAKEHPKSKTAEKLLDPPTEPPQPNNPIRVPNMGNLRLQIPNLKQGRIRIRIQSINGKKDVLIEENGTKLHVVEGERGIEVEKTDAAGKTEKKLYKNLDELKKDDPETHKRFEKATEPRRGIGFRFGGPQLTEDFRKRLEKSQRESDQRLLRRLEEMGNLQDLNHLLRQKTEERLERIRNRQDLSDPDRQKVEELLKQLRQRQIESEPKPNKPPKGIEIKELKPKLRGVIEV